MELSNLKATVKEFIRYAIVGGVSFILDYLTLVLLHEYIIPEIAYSLYISNFFGFIVGIICSYILSIKFVFLAAKTSRKGQSNSDKLIFLIIGIVGLLINELGMFLGTDILFFDYRFIKLVMAGVVLIWNYFARKKLIFNSIELQE